MPESVTLEGRFVRLEPLTLQHVAALVAAANESRDTYAFARVPADADAMAAYVTAALEEQCSGWGLPFAMRALCCDRVVGSTRFLDLDYWPWLSGRTRPQADGVPAVGEIGSTWLAASAQRTALNSESKLLLLTHAFDIWRVQRITLKTDARNRRSRQAIERLGAQFEGVRRAHMRAVDDAIRDTAYYSILRAEWPGVREWLRRRLERGSADTPTGPSLLSSR